MQHADLEDEKRIQDLLLEMRNDLKSRIIPRGNTFAMLRAAAQLSPIAAKEERLRGISQLAHLQRLSKSEQGVGPLAEKLTLLRDRLVDRSRLQVVITGDDPIRDEAVRTLSPHLDSFSHSRPSGPMVIGSGSIPPIGTGEIGEFILLPGTVGFAAAACPGARLGEELHPPQSVLSHMLSTGYLWEKIRMQGGAYGANAGTNGTEGIFTFSSYRDPRFPVTPRIFREALEETAGSVIDKKALETAIIGTVGRDAYPIAPGIRGLIALRRLLYGITDAIRQQKRDKLLAMVPNQLSQAAQAVLERFDSGVTVIAGPESIAVAADLSLEGTIKTEISL
jgi:Zn-dependent M16 (insulinase) family peptidase